MWTLHIPRLTGAYTGTGDLTAALFLAHLGSDLGLGGAYSGGATGLPDAMAKVSASVAAVIRRTLAAAGPGGELRLVQSKADLERPDCAAFVPERLGDDAVATARAALSLL